MRMDFSPSGRNGQRVIVGNSSRVPIPIMRSVCWPQPIGRGHGQSEFVGIGDDAASAAERHDRRIDQFGEFKDFIAGLDRARADEDHRRFACRDQGWRPT